MDQNGIQIIWTPRLNKIISALSPHQQIKKVSLPPAQEQIKLRSLNAILSLAKDCSRDTLVSEGGGNGRGSLGLSLTKIPLVHASVQNIWLGHCHHLEEQSASRRLNVELSLSYLGEKTTNAHVFSFKDYYLKYHLLLAKLDGAPVTNFPLLVPSLPVCLCSSLPPSLLSFPPSVKNCEKPLWISPLNCPCKPSTNNLNLEVHWFCNPCAISNLVALQLICIK